MARIILNFNGKFNGLLSHCRALRLHCTSGSAACDLAESPHCASATGRGTGALTEAATPSQAASGSHGTSSPLHWQVLGTAQAAAATATTIAASSPLH